MLWKHWCSILHEMDLFRGISQEFSGDGEWTMLTGSSPLLSHVRARFWHRRSSCEFMGMLVGMNQMLAYAAAPDATRFSRPCCLFCLGVSHPLTSSVPHRVKTCADQTLFPHRHKLRPQPVACVPTQPPHDDILSCTRLHLTATRPQRSLLIEGFRTKQLCPRHPERSMGRNVPPPWCIYGIVASWHRQLYIPPGAYLLGDAGAAADNTSRGAQPTATVVACSTTSASCMRTHAHLPLFLFLAATMGSTQSKMVLAELGSKVAIALASCKRSATCAGPSPRSSCSRNHWRKPRFEYRGLISLPGAIDLVTFIPAQCEMISLSLVTAL